MPCVFLGYIRGWISQSHCHHGACALSLPGISFGLGFSIAVFPWDLCLVFTQDRFRAGFLHPGAATGLVSSVYLGCVWGWISRCRCHPGARALCLPRLCFGLDFSHLPHHWHHPVTPGSGTRRSQTLHPLMPRGRGDAGRGWGGVCLPKLGSGWVFNIPRHAGLFLLAAACQLSPGMFILTATCGQGWCQLYGIGYADLALGTRPPAPRARKAARAARPNVKQLNSSSSPCSSFNPCWAGAACFHSSAFPHHPIPWPLSHLLLPKLPQQQNV